MIRQIRVNNFRTFVNLVADLKERHLLIGLNCSGKSNFGHALIFTKLTSLVPLSNAVNSMPGGMWDFCNYELGVKNRRSMFEITVSPTSFDPTTFAYVLEIEIPDPRFGGIGRPPKLVREDLRLSSPQHGESWLIRNDGKRARLLDQSFQGGNHSSHQQEMDCPADSTILAKLFDRNAHASALKFRDRLQAIYYYRFSSERLRWGWRDTTTSDGLSADGATLAHVIYRMKTTEEGRYRRVLERVQRIEPKLTAINFLTAGEQSVPIAELEGNRPSAWQSLSDGTLKALGISVICEFCNDLARNDTSATVICDEVENSLFVGELRHILYDVENVAPAAQFVFTTHSPYLIDLFDADLSAVTVFQRKQWITELRSLVDRRAEIEKALETMPLGDQFFYGLLK